MKRNINVLQYGIGPIGAKITKFILDRENIKIVGAVDIDPEKIGKDLGEAAGIGRKLGVIISGNIEEELSRPNIDVVVLTTASGLDSIKPQLSEIVAHRINVVSTCEELTFPWKTNSSFSKEIDEAARLNNVSVLSTGVNPGFLMDFLPSALTAVSKDVEKILVERIQNAQFRRIPFQRKIGAGLTPGEFRKRIDDGSLRHVGLTESMHMIASKLGWELDKTEDIIEPVIAEERTEAGELIIEKGNALGVRQTGRGFSDGEELITLNFIAAVGQPSPKDRIFIKGTPDIDMTIKDGVNGDTATCAITVNAIEAVLNAEPGLRTMIDIPIVGWGK